MAVIIIVEDGTIVAAANSFVTLDEYKKYATDRGVALPTNDDTLSSQLIKSTDFIGTLERRFAGYRVSDDQTLPFPRIGVPVPGRPGFAYGETDIPPDLKAGQMALALAVNSGVDLNPTVTGKFIKMKKIGPIETQYSEAVQANGGSYVPAAMGLLVNLFMYNGFGLTSVRV